MAELQLYSKENQMFKCSEQLTNMCLMLRDMLEDTGDASEPIKLPIPGKHLEDIILFCKHYDFQFPEAS